MIPSQRKPDQSRRITTTPQPVPVHITYRNQVQHDIGERTDPNRSFLTSPSTRKTLIVGDSLFKEINPKGLENGVRICKKNGAKIKDIWDEVAVYDLKSFQNIIVCVGGNDSSSGTDAHMFEKKYDELVGGIRTANNDCTIYLCKVVPRGDVDVTRINASIENVANNWRMQQVMIVASTNEMFFGPNGLPCGRYYDTDGIHMSHSGTKRLIHAINKHVLVAHDFQFCVFRGQQQSWGNRRRPSPGHYQGSNSRAVQYGRGNRDSRFKGQWTNQRRTCFACSMPGHVVAECWFTH